MTNTATFVTLTPVSPPGTGLTFALLGDSTYGQATSGTGGWQIVDRPKQVAATQWYDRSPFQLDLPLLLDSQMLFGTPGISIEAQCLQIRSWLDAAQGTLIPPVLKIGGPVPGTDQEWVLYTLAYNEAIRDPSWGFRTQQNLQVSLYEYQPPLVNNNTGTPVQQAAAATAQLNQYITYTVKAGDTLGSIAARNYGNYNIWPFIANINGIRDPDSLVPGDTLNLPVNSQLIQPGL